MNFLQALKPPYNKPTAWLSLLGIVIGIVSAPEFMAWMPEWPARIITLLSALVLGVSKSLKDEDGDGTPDIFQ